MMLPAVSLKSSELGRQLVSSIAKLTNKDSSTSLSMNDSNSHTHLLSIATVLTPLLLPIAILFTNAARAALSLSLSLSMRCSMRCWDTKDQTWLQICERDRRQSKTNTDSLLQVSDLIRTNIGLNQILNPATLSVLDFIDKCRLFKIDGITLAEIVSYKDFWIIHLLSAILT